MTNSEIILQAKISKERENKIFPYDASFSRKSSLNIYLIHTHLKKHMLYGVASANS